jgi:hypothetical protein
LWLAVSLLAASPGCQPAKPARPVHDTLRPGDLPGEMTSSGQPVSPDQLTPKDRCPARLHDIEGALLLYYALKKEMPRSLDELHSISETKLELTCPDSGLPYTYVPNGLRKRGGTKRIIVHDATMNRDGTRWCIVASDGRPGAPQSTEVVQMAEPIFLSYQ